MSDKLTETDIICYLQNVTAKIYDKKTKGEVIRTYLGGKEFGEIIHMAGLYNQLNNSGYKFEIDVIQPISSELVGFLKRAGGSKNIKYRTSEKLTESEVQYYRKKLPKDKHKYITTKAYLSTLRKAGVYDFDPAASTMLLDKLAGCSGKEFMDNILLYAGKLKNSITSNFPNGLKSDFTKNKILVWVRKSSGNSAGRGMSKNALEEIISEIKLAKGIPLIIGDGVGEALSQGTVKGFYYDLSKFHNSCMSEGESGSVPTQIAMYEFLRNHGVVGSIGMTTGGMDLGTLCGIPSVSIYSNNAFIMKRLESFGRVTGGKSMSVSDASNYHAINQPTLGNGVASSAVSHIKGAIQTEVV